MTKPLALIVGHDGSVTNAFGRYGFLTLALPWHTRLDDIRKAMKNSSVVVFTGGEDIDPSFYGQERLQFTHTSDNRNQAERKFFLLALEQEKPIAGICRGGQLANALSGGNMWQHINNHAGQHKVTDIRSGLDVVVSSIHHQMMRPDWREAELIAWCNLSSLKISDKEEQQLNLPRAYSLDFLDPEALYYKNTKSLCFQGHPEYGPDSCTKYFFTLVQDYLGIECDMEGGSAPRATHPFRSAIGSDLIDDGSDVDNYNWFC